MSSSKLKQRAIDVLASALFCILLYYALNVWAAVMTSSIRRQGKAEVDCRVTEQSKIDCLVRGEGRLSPVHVKNVQASKIEYIGGRNTYPGVLLTLNGENRTERVAAVGAYSARLEELKAVERKISEFIKDPEQGLHIEINVHDSPPYKSKEIE